MSSTDAPDSSASLSRRRLLRTAGAAAAGLAAPAVVGDRAAATTRGDDRRAAGSVPFAQMRHAFRHEVDVITGDRIPVDAVRKTAHPDAEYVGVVPGVTFTRPEYEAFLSLLRGVVFDRTLRLVGEGFVVTGPHTSQASWVLCGTLPDSTRLCLPARGEHRWAPNGKCIRAEVNWLAPDATAAFVAAVVEHASPAAAAAAGLDPSA